MGKTKIQWPGLTDTWNVQTGCKNGCKYCVVRNRVWPRIKQFYGGHDYNEVHFHPEKLTEYDNKKNKKIFVNFYSDPRYTIKEWWALIIGKCRQNETNEYLFLSKGKCPYWGLSFPKNCVLGITMTFCNGEEDLLHNYLSHHNRGFISIEPLLGEFRYSSLALAGPFIELVIVGAMTGANAVKPEKRWIQSVIDNVPAEKIHWKPNIHKYLKEYGYTKLI